MPSNDTKPKNRFFNYLKKNKLKILIFILGLCVVAVGVISNLQNIRTQIARAGGIITYQDVSNIYCSNSSITAGDSFNCTLTMLEDMSNYTGDLSIRINDGNTDYDYSCDGLPSSGFDLNCSIFTDSNMREGGSLAIQYGNITYGFGSSSNIDVYKNFDVAMVGLIQCNEFGLVGTNRNCYIQLNVNSSSYINGNMYIKVGNASGSDCGSISSFGSSGDCSFDPGTQIGIYTLEFSSDNNSWTSIGGDYIVRETATNNSVNNVNCFANVELNSFTNCEVQMSSNNANLYEGTVDIQATPVSTIKTCNLPVSTEILYCTGVSVGSATGTFQPQFRVGADSFTDTSGTITVSGFSVTSISPNNLNPAGGQAITITGNNFASGIYANLQSFGNTGNDTLRSLAVDSSGNKYIAGEFDSSITLGSTTLNTTGGSDVFIAKVDSSGDFLWAVKAGGTQNDGLSRTNGMAIDKNDGNIILTGYFQGTAAFGATNLSSNGGGDTAFFAKINSSNGAFIWAKKVGNLSNQYIGSDGWPLQAGMGVETDTSGNVYGTGLIATDPNLTKSDPFIVKYDSNGNQTWLKIIAETQETLSGNFLRWNDGRGTHLVVKGDDLYAVGSYSNTADFGNGVFLTVKNVNSRQGNIYLAKLSATSGDTVWAKSMGSGNYVGGNEIPYGVALDSSDNVFVTGYVIAGSDSAIFGPYSLNSVTNDGFENIIFLTKLNPSGDFQWVRPLRGSSNGTNTSRDMFIDSSDTIYIAGVETGTLTNGATTVLGDQSNAFYATYDTSGVLQDLKVIAGSGGSVANTTNGTGGNQARAIAIDPSGRLVIAGEYVGTIGIGANIVTSAGNTDGFLVIYDPNIISIKIGNTEIFGTVVNSTTITATSPALTSNTYDVQVTKYSGSFGLLTNGATYGSGSSPITNSDVTSLSCTPTSANINTTVNCTITTNVNLNTLSGSVNVRIGASGTPTTCSISGGGTTLACNNVGVGSTVGIFNSQFNASGSGASYLDGNAITITSNIVNCSNAGSSNTPGQTVVDLCVDGGTLTLYAGDSTKNNDICTTVDITAGNVVDTTISGQSATSVTCSTAENSIALTGVTVDSKRQFATATIDDIIFEDLRGLVTSNYSVTATVSNFADPNDNNKRIDLGSNPDSVSNETDQDKPQTSNDQNKIFGVLDASSGSITPLRSAITIAEGTSNYTRGSRITLIDNITQATLLSTSAPVKPGRIALDNVLFKLRIPSLISAGNFQGTIVQTVI